MGRRRGVGRNEGEREEGNEKRGCRESEGRRKGEVRKGEGGKKGVRRKEGGKELGRWKERRKGERRKGEEECFDISLQQPKHRQEIMNARRCPMISDQTDSGLPINRPTSFRPKSNRHGLPSCCPDVHFLCSVLVPSPSSWTLFITIYMHYCILYSGSSYRSSSLALHRPTFIGVPLSVRPPGFLLHIVPVCLLSSSLAALHPRSLLHLFFLCHVSSN